MKAIGFLYEGDQIVGVKARDLLTDQVVEIHAKIVINTSGPWVDKIRNLNFKRAVSPKMRPTKGVHLVVDAKNCLFHNQHILTRANKMAEWFCHSTRK